MKAQRVRLFLAPMFGTSPCIRIIRDTRAVGVVGEQNTQLFKKMPADYAFTSFEFTSDLPTADFILVPQAVRALTPAIETYLESVRRLAREHSKRIIVTIGKDDSHDIHIPGMIVFCKSVYKHTRQKDEYQITPFVEDLGESIPFVPRTKGEKPVIGFCGYASFPRTATYLKYVIKNALLDVAALLLQKPVLKAYKRGIYFRRKAIQLLEQDARVTTNFIIRSSYFGNPATISADPVAARREYIENILASDFVLAPKGDANHSDRFFEALSLGRIPLLIDTDMVLPLEDTLNYEEFIIRVPHTDIENIGSYVTKRFNALTNESFAAMQEKARGAFKQYLRYDSFFNTILPRLV